MKRNAGSLAVAGFVTLSALLGGAAHAAGAYASATVAGALAPGVYGRIDIGNAPPPPLMYAQPMIIQRPPVYVQQPPLYLHVPPGHARKWSKHCAKYNACSRPVYFVKVQGDDGYERRHGQDRYRGYDNNQGNPYENRREYRHEYRHEERNENRHGEERGRGHGNDHEGGRGNGKGHGRGHGRD